MKLKNLPKAEPALEPRYIKNLGIKSYDADNLYPQNVRNIVLNSKTGNGCLERYADYLEGRGITSSLLAGHIINLNGETLADLHGLVSKDLATFNGFAIHVNYNIDGRIVDMHHVPFENVRLVEADDAGVIRQVALHPDWSGQETRGGKPIKVNKDTVDFIDVFNPDPTVVLKQMLEAGGPQYYNGQVLYYSREGHLQYPFATFHAVLTEMSTDEGISNVLNRNVRNNFLPAGAFVRLKGNGAPFTGDGLTDDQLSDDDTYSEDLMALQGDMESVNIMDITVESKDDVPSFINMRGTNYDAEFTNTATETKDCIYAKFGQEGWLAIRNGKVGFSGTLIADVERDYAKRNLKIQAAMTRSYMAILANWATILPEPATSEALTIVPLVDLTPTKTTNA